MTDTTNRGQLSAEALTMYGASYILSLTVDHTTPGDERRLTLTLASELADDVHIVGGVWTTLVDSGKTEHRRKWERHGNNLVRSGNYRSSMQEALHTIEQRLAALPEAEQLQAALEKLKACETLETMFATQQEVDEYEKADKLLIEEVRSELLEELLEADRDAIEDLDSQAIEIADMKSEIGELGESLAAAMRKQSEMKAEHKRIAAAVKLVSKES